MLYIVLLKGVFKLLGLSLKASLLDSESPDWDLWSRRGTLLLSADKEATYFDKGKETCLNSLVNLALGG